jgi:biotin carboxyl carrier protein
MNITNVDTLRSLIVTMRKAGVVELEFKDGQDSIRLHASSANYPSKIHTISVQVKAPASGYLSLSSPDGCFKLPQIGDQVERGSILAFLSVGPTYLAIRATIAGKLASAQAVDGQLIELNNHLFDIHPNLDC